MSPVPCSRFISVKTAAEYLGVNFQTIYSWIASGQIPSIRIGRAVRVDLRKLDEQLEASVRKGGAS